MEKGDIPLPPAASCDEGKGSSSVCSSSSSSSSGCDKTNNNNSNSNSNSNSNNHRSTKESENHHPFARNANNKNDRNVIISHFRGKSSTSPNDFLSSGFRIGTGESPFRDNQPKYQRRRRDPRARRERMLSVDASAMNNSVGKASEGSGFASVPSQHRTSAASTAGSGSATSAPAAAEAGLPPRGLYRPKLAAHARSATFTGDIPAFSPTPNTTAQWGNQARGFQHRAPSSPSAANLIGGFVVPPPPSPPVLSPRSEFMANVQEQWSESARQTLRKQSLPSLNAHAVLRSTDNQHSYDDRRRRSGYGSFPSPSSYRRISVSERNLMSGVGQFRDALYHSEMSPLWNSDSKLDPDAICQDSSVQTATSGDETGSDSSSSLGRRASVAAMHGPHNNRFSPMAVLRRRTDFGTCERSDSNGRQRFLPLTFAADDDDKNFYICPVCKTRQREFFTVSNAPKQIESASRYVAAYFGIYVVTALYLFGLQEGWDALDCIYFAVITLTTAGLGDLTPSSDSAKISCSIFIYFGVACIGLLLGTYIASMLDESSRREAKANRMKSCPNCAKIQNIRDAMEKRHARSHPSHFLMASTHDDGAHVFFSERSPHQTHHAYEPDAKKVKRQHDISSQDSMSMMPFASFSERIPHTSPTSAFNSPSSDAQAAEDQLGTNQSPRNPISMSSPFTSQMLGRQSHTKHASLDLSSDKFLPTFTARGRMFSAELPATIEENGSAEGDAATRYPFPSSRFSSSPCNETDDDSSYISGYSTGSERRGGRGKSKDEFNNVKNAKYVFLTLKEALVNSIFIIAFGCLGFFFIEGFSIVDSWYFTTVLLTTVGYGDIVPVTNGGKLFAIVYILIAGTILLNNMSMISMIPLELRKRRIERAVLTQFGDQLDDAALRELATGALVQRLKLSAQRPDGLDECTREMFALAMLVRLGKVTEEDIHATFRAFNRLDVYGDGVLNSRTIIAGMIQKSRAQPRQTQQHSVPPQASMFGGSYFYDFGYRNEHHATNRSPSSTSSADANQTVSPQNEIHSPHSISQPCETKGIHPKM